MRFAGKFVSITSMMRPGLGLITTILDDRNTASGIECVTNTTVFFVRRPQLQQLLVQLVAHDFIERPERLIHQQQLRINRQRPRNGNPLLHAARQLPGKFLLKAAEIHQFQIALHPLGRHPPCPMISSGSPTFFSTVRHG